MGEAKRRLVVAWASKAEDDLAVARLLILDERRLLAAGVYHCQQAAEKMLKAWLTLHDVVFPRTHDLEVLLNLADTKPPGFVRYRTHAQRLTPLASEYRYPGDVDSPAPDQARQILELAEELCSEIAEAVHFALQSGKE